MIHFPDEADYVTINNTTEAILFAFTIVSVLLEIFLLYVIIWKSPSTMQNYRFFLILIAIWDLLFSLHVGLLFQPLEGCCSPTHTGMIGLLTSLAYYLGSYGAHITFGSAAFLIGFMSVTQMYTLAYRYAVLNQDSEVSEKFLRKITIAGFFVVAIAIGLFYAWCMFNTLESPQRVEALLNTSPRGNISNREIIEWKTSFWKQWIWPMNELVFMIDLDKSAPYFLAKAVVVGLGIFVVVCSVLIFLVFYKMRRNASNYSAQTIQMHKRLTQLLIVQITMPITLVLIPAAITLVALQFSLEMGDFSYMYRNFIIVLYSPFNCIITFLFITPYRKYMKGLIARLLHIKPKTIEVTPVNSTNTVITVVQSA